MKPLTEQQRLVMDFVEEYGSITPAKVGGRYYRGKILGSESSRRCRELRKMGRLVDYKNGKFTSFKLPSTNQSTLQLVKQHRMEKETEQLTLL